MRTFNGYRHLEKVLTLSGLCAAIMATGCETSMQGEEIAPLWGVETEADTGWSSPAIGPDRTIYLGDASGTLYAVTDLGDGETEMKWGPAEIGTDLSGASPVLSEDATVLYVGEMASPGRVFAVDTDNGEVIWTYTLPPPDHLEIQEDDQQLGGGINSSTVLSRDEQTIYFGTGNWIECNPCSGDILDDRFFALDVSGSEPQLKWVLKGTQVDPRQSEERYSFWANAAIAEDGTLYIGNFNGFLYHIEDQGDDFEILHRFNFVDHQTHKAVEEEIPPEIWSSAAIGDDGSVYVASNDGQMWAFESDLTVRWRVEYEYGGDYYEAFASPVITPDDLVIMSNEKGYVYGYDATTGDVAWRFPDEENPEEQWWRSPAVNADGLVVLGSEKASRYYALDSATGELAWMTPEIGEETGCFPAIGDDGTIYVTGGYGGGLYALPGTAPLANTAWPKGMRDNRNSGH